MAMVLLRDGRAWQRARPRNQDRPPPTQRENHFPQCSACRDAASTGCAFVVVQKPTLRTLFPANGGSVRVHPDRFQGNRAAVAGVMIVNSWSKRSRKVRGAGVLGGGESDRGTMARWIA